MWFQVLNCYLFQFVRFGLCWYSIPKTKMIYIHLPLTEIVPLKHKYNPTIFLSVLKTGKVYQLKTMGIGVGLLRKTMARIVYQLINFSWNGMLNLFCKVKFRFVGNVFFLESLKVRTTLICNSLSLTFLKNTTFRKSCFLGFPSLFGMKM